MRVLLMLMLILIQVGAVASASGLASRLNPTFDRIDPSDGLSQTSVNVISQDSMGLIWIGTTEGLNRYDGEKFDQYFSNEKESNSLSNDYVSAIVEDASGVLWVGTDKGLNVFDRHTSNFSLISLADQTTIPVPGIGSIRSLFIDKQENLWIGTGGGLVKRSNNGSLTFYIHDPADADTIGKGAVRAIAEDSQRNIWIGTEDSGLSRLNPESGAIQRFERDFQAFGASDSSVRDILIRSGEMFIATFNGGLWRVDTDTLQFRRVRLFTTRGQEVSRTRSLLLDASGGLWVGSDYGLFLIDPVAASAQNFSHRVTDPGSLSHNVVAALFEDMGGVLWVGTYNGLSKWNSRTPRFALFRSDKNTEQGLVGDSITSFAESDTTLWVGTLNGLSAYDKSLSEFRVVEEISLQDQRVMTLAVAGTGDSTLWLGTFNGGLTSLSAGIQRNYLSNTNPGSLASNQVSKVFVDSKQRLWVGMYGSGVDLHLGDGRFEHYPREGAIFSDTRITDIAESPDGNIWITSNGGGLMILDPENSSTTILRHDASRVESIASDNLVSVSRGSSGMWVGARDAGVSFVDSGTLEVRRITKMDGLSSVAAYGVLEDPEGSIWVSGGKGLSVLAEDGDWDIYDTSHGLQADDFNSGAYLKMKDGTFLYGGNYGFNAFNPLDIYPSDFSPRVELTGFKKLNNNVSFETSFDKLERIEVYHDDYVIEFEYGAMDYSSPLRNEYEYLLEGFDPDWVSADNDRSVAYTNLDPGSYTFRVRATNGDGIWSSDQLEVELNVLPPWFQTWWAYLGYLILAVLVLTGIYRLNAQRMARIAEDSHRARLEKYIQTLEQATDAIAIASEEGVIEYQNALFLALFKTPELDSGVGSQLLETLFDSAEERAEVESRVVESGRFSTEVVRRLAVDKFYEISVARTEYQGVVTLIAIARDITQRKETERQLEHYSRNLETQVIERTSKLEEEVSKSLLQQQALTNSLAEKELLIKEVHHRVKNNMQVISSLLSIQAEGVDDEVYSSLLKESQQRIKSMTLIHETLYQSKDLLNIDFQDYIELLTNSLSRSYVVPGVSVFVDVNVENVVLDLGTAVPCGLIINELVSNSLKHAFHDKEETGIIDIDFVTTDCSFDLRISDNGSGLPPDFDLGQNTSMGLEIVTILTDQLEGSLSAHNDDGAVFQISFPRQINE
jgi:PAS domain S-box-containing protein